MSEPQAEDKPAAARPRWRRLALLVVVLAVLIYLAHIGWRLAASANRQQAPQSEPTRQDDSGDTPKRAMPGNKPNQPPAGNTQPGDPNDLLAPGPQRLRDFDDEWRQLYRDSSPPPP